MVNRKGGISIVRMSIIAALIGFGLVALAVVSYLSDQQSKRSPLNIAVYPDSADWGISEERATSRNVFYLSADTPEEVVAYYQQKMNEHYGNSDQRCIRFPATGESPGSSSDPNIAPYIFRCMFDNSGFNSSQYTQVEVYPGRANENPDLNSEGLTIIKYAQQWQR